MQPRAAGSLQSDEKLPLDTVSSGSLFDPTKDPICVKIRKFWEEPITRQFDRMLQDPDNPANLNIFERLDIPLNNPDPRFIPEERKLLQPRIDALRQKESSARTPIENLLTFERANLFTAAEQGLTLALVLICANHEIGQSIRHDETLKPNIKKFQETLKEQAKAGNPLAQYNFFESWTVIAMHKDYKQITALEKVARAGIASAALDLRCIYHEKELYDKNKADYFENLAAHLGSHHCISSEYRYPDLNRQRITGRWAYFFRLVWSLDLLHRYTIIKCPDFKGFIAILQKSSANFDFAYIYHLMILFKMVEPQLRAFFNEKRINKLSDVEYILFYKFNLFAQTQIAYFVTLLSFETQRDQTRIFNFLDENSRNVVRVYCESIRGPAAQALARFARMPTELSKLTADFLLPVLDSKQTEEEAWQEIVSWEKMLPQKIALNSSADCVPMVVDEKGVETEANMNRKRKKDSSAASDGSPAKLSKTGLFADVDVGTMKERQRSSAKSNQQNTATDMDVDAKGDASAAVKMDISS